MLDRGIRVQTNRTHALIRQVFSYAVSEERVVINPAAGIKPMADERPRDGVLTDAELKALWGALEAPVGLRKPARKGSDKTVPIYIGRSMAICLQLCAILLQRRVEIAGMMIEELDLDGAVWTIPGERMKGSRTQVVYLPPRSVELIREAIVLAKERYGDDVVAVFPGGHDETHGIRPDSITHTMRDVMAALGFKNAAPHDLRRTGATNMVRERLGFPPCIVSKALGHTSDTGGAAAVTLATTPSTTMPLISAKPSPPGRSCFSRSSKTRTGRSSCGGPPSRRRSSNAMRAAGRLMCHWPTKTPRSGPRLCRR